MKKCLIVDDDEISRKIIKDVASDFDLEIFEVAGGAEALNICMQNIPDLIILDWMMPNVDGLEFLYEFRAIEGNQACFVIMCTAKSSDNHPEAMDAGADAYITKPFEIEDLHKVLQLHGFIRN